MIILFLAYAYVLLGLLVAIWFSFFKIHKIDKSAAGSSFWFRLIIMPATMLIWPIVMLKLNTKN